MSDETQQPNGQQPNGNEVIDLSKIEIPASEWELEGKNKAGAIGFKIDAATLEMIATKNGPRPKARFECTIVQRKEGRVEGEKFFAGILLTPIGLGQFKKLAAACGVKPQPGQPVRPLEICKALNGRTAFGLIVHREYTQNGEKQISAEFGKKFGKTMAEITT